MALIKCEDCGQMVSDKEKACPNCGCPMSKKKSKRGLYVIFGIVLLEAVVGAIAYLYQDLAKKEAEAKSEVEKMRQELREQRTRDSLAMVQVEEKRAAQQAIEEAAQQATEEAALEQEEQERIAEEERMRREGVEKVVTLTRFVSSDYKVSANSNYGGEVWTGMFHFANYAFTKRIVIPRGRVWIYKRSEVVCGNPRNLHLFYFSRDQRFADEVTGNKTYLVADGGLPVLRSGDEIRLAINSDSEGEHTMNIYFTEKDESYYY